MNTGTGRYNPLTETQMRNVVKALEYAQANGEQRGDKVLKGVAAEALKVIASQEIHYTPRDAAYLADFAADVASSIRD